MTGVRGWGGWDLVEVVVGGPVDWVGGRLSGVGMAGADGRGGRGLGGVAVGWLVGRSGDRLSAVRVGGVWVGVGCGGRLFGRGRRVVPARVVGAGVIRVRRRRCGGWVVV
ncbi:hypothetical protein GCM10027184_65860 [Saccharothrix stipae]